MNIKAARRTVFMLVVFFVVSWQGVRAFQDLPILIAGRWRIIFPNKFQCINLSYPASSDFLSISSERSFTSIADIEFSQPPDLESSILTIRDYEDPTNTYATLLGAYVWSFAGSDTFSNFDPKRYSETQEYEEYGYTTLRVLTPEHMEATVTLIQSQSSICRLTASLTLVEAVEDWSSTTMGSIPHPYLLEPGMPAAGVDSGSYVLFPIFSDDLSIRIEGSLDGLTGKLTDENGSIIEPVNSIDEGDTRTEVYHLQRFALYGYEVTAPGNYTLTVLDSDVLGKNQDILTLGSSISGSIVQGQQKVYTLQANPGERIVIHTDRNDSVFSGLVDATGFPVASLSAELTNSIATLDYVLTGPAPYHFIVQGQNSTSYSISVDAGDSVNDAILPVHIGEPVTVVGSSRGYAVYELDEADSWALGTLVNDPVNRPSISVIDSKGTTLKPHIDFSDNRFFNLSGGIYVLPSTGPNYLTVTAPEGMEPMTLTIVSGFAVTARTASEPRIFPSSDSPPVQSDQHNTLEVAEGQPLLVIAQDETGEWVMAATLETPQPVDTWMRPISFWVEKDSLVDESGNPLGELPVAQGITIPNLQSSGTATCVVSAASTVNLRSGPGTNFDIVGKLTAGQEYTPSGRTEVVNGMVWWQLEDGNWVSSEVVNEVGDCEAVPVITH